LVRKGNPLTNENAIKLIEMDNTNVEHEKDVNSILVMCLKEKFIRCEMLYNGQLLFKANPIIHNFSSKTLMKMLKERGYNIDADTMDEFLK
jgi:hypothetical protein